MNRLIERCVPLLVIYILITGCSSPGSYDTGIRRQRLLEMYPVRKTTQRDVAKRWKDSPEKNAVRPKDGWKTHPDTLVAEFTENAEKRTGKKIRKVERYFGSDGMFSLCYCWFYYDASGRLLDAEWQWSSD